MSLSEKSIENRLMREVRKRGGLCLKFVSPGFSGVPDRLVLLPDAHMGFVEVKAPGKKPGPLQAARIEKLRALGFKAYVLDDPERIKEILDEICTL